VYKILVGKCEGNRPLGRRRQKRENNIRMDLTEIGLKEEIGLDSSGSGQILVVGYCELGNEPSGCIKGREFLEYLCILLAS
jgi:hypothetical protein